MTILRPSSIEEACKALREADQAGVSARAISGGTALMLLRRAGFFEPALLVSLTGLRQELAGLAHRDGIYGIGALATLEELKTSAVAVGHRGVRDALKRLANPRVRNVATLGGHLAHADPHMDLPAVLLALDARVRTVGATSGPRSLSISELITGYYQSTLEAGEIITRVEVPDATPDQESAYAKFTFLAQDDWPTVGVAVMYRKATGDLKLVASAVGDKPVRLRAAENYLSAEGVHPEAIRIAASLASDEVDPTDDLHGSGSYKRKVLCAYVCRVLRLVTASDGQRGTDEL